MNQVAEAGPMAEMNTTPLIDVMLVLLIMFVITIPVATHSVDIDLPTEGCLRCPALDTLKNKVAIRNDDTVLWNGQPVSQEQLATLLRQTTLMPIEPELQYEPDANASYAVAAHTLNIIKASGVTKFGFVGNELYRQFERVD